MVFIPETCLKNKITGSIISIYGMNEQPPTAPFGSVAENGNQPATLKPTPLSAAPTRQLTASLPPA